jgi:hypothetical protein
MAPNFQPAPPAPVTLTDPGEIAAKYRSWQRRVLVFSIFGYAMFYFVRKNLGVAMPFIGRDLGITKGVWAVFDVAWRDLWNVKVYERLSSGPGRTLASLCPRRFWPQHC